MSETTGNIAETTANPGNSDILAEALNAMRISGSLLLYERYIPPWAVSVPDSKSLAGIFNCDQHTQIAAFHLVERGYMEVTAGQQEKVLLQAGELLIIFSGNAHVLQQSDGKKPIDLQHILSTGENPFRPEEGEYKPDTTLVCGAFLLSNTKLNPLFQSLPTLLKISYTAVENSSRIPEVAKLLLHEIRHQKHGSAFVIQRYLEVLCAESIRIRLQSHNLSSGNWLRAQQDVIINHALSLIHKFPEKNWTVKRLAEQANLSATRFTARFTEAVGDSPMVYVTKWRMYLASLKLEQGSLSLEQIANLVGYENVSAFSRTFRKYFACPPGSWRNNRNAKIAKNAG